MVRRNTNGGVFFNTPSSQDSKTDGVSCILALSYSNVPQVKKGTPAVVVGLLTNKSLLDQLEKVDINEKESLMRSRNSLLRFEQISEELAEYVLDSRVKVIPYIGNPIDEVRQSYSAIARELIEGTLYQFQRVGIYARKVIGYGFGENDISPDFPSNAAVLFCTKKTKSNFFKLARIVARLHFEKERKISSSNILDRVKNHYPNNFQIVRMRWNSPPIEDYNGLTVGSPFLVVKKPTVAHFETRSIEVGQQLHISPIARFCIGENVDGDLSSCVHTDGNANPYGAILVNSLSEKCYECSLRSLYSKCAFQRPACDGLQVACGEYAFAGRFCLGTHSLYVTHFGKTLKVGTAYSTNVVGRLLEQGASSALILSPINGVKMASDLELAITHRLEERYVEYHKSDPKNDIDKVVFRGPSSKDRLESFLGCWSNQRTELLEDVRRFLFSEKITLGQVDVQMNKARVDSWIISFANSYENPGNLERYAKAARGLDSKSIHQYDDVAGRVTGYRGQFIFLSEDNIIDMKAMRGFVVEGTLGD